MRSLVAFAVLAGLVAAAPAQDKKPDEPKSAPPREKKAEEKRAIPKQLAPQPERPEPTLKVGDPAPPLKADKWLQGTEVQAFGAGKVYVVEFWATWCGPCIVMMPHMSELQAEYRDRGVTLIGFTGTNDTNNTPEKVSAFVAKRGPKLGYTFASEHGQETNDAWMQAAGRNGIPCCFVVDQAGKIAYIGHPMYLDAVLPKVVAGTWTEADVKGLDEIEAEVTKVFRALGGPDAEAGLTTLSEFESKHPKLAGIPYFNAGRLNAMLKLKKYGEAAAAAKALLAKASKQEDPLAIRTVSAVMRSPLAADRKELLGLSVAAADALLKVSGDADLVALTNAGEAAAAAGDTAKAREYAKQAAPLAEKELRNDKDSFGMLRVADLHLTAGDKAKAKEWAEKAVAAAPTPQVKTYIEGRAKKYLGDEGRTKDVKPDDK